MTVWLVASGGALERWSPAFEDADLDWVALIVSHLAAPPAPEAISRALRAREHDLVFLTSSNAVAHVDPREAAGWSAVCVGQRTADVAKAVGFDVVFVGSQGAEALARGLLSVAPGVERVLFLRGETARTEGPDALRDAGVRVDEVVSYAMTPEPGFERAAQDAATPDVIVVGSPRAAEALLAVRPDVKAGRFVAIGESTRAHLVECGVNVVDVATSARVADLVQAVKQGANE